jgi:hypothetical protein
MSEQIDQFFRPDGTLISIPVGEFLRAIQLLMNFATKQN